MSGGVDSAVSAALLVRAGHTVTGVFMRLGQPGQEQQEGEARAVAAHLGIGLEVVDLAAEFARQVVAPFVEAYAWGKTPNPCVVCNRHIKFGRLLELAVPRYGDRLATGHYARLVADGDGRGHLWRGKDPNKDQSYFLCGLGQQQLQRLLLPLGGHGKAEVREMAAAMGIRGRHGEESQDVCFLGHQSVADFVGQRALSPPGAIVTADGRLLGRHNGLHCYTIGQRRGLGIPDATPWYVVGLDAARNTVVVGKPEALLCRLLLVDKPHWLAGRPPLLPAEFLVKLRYRHEAASARVEAAEEGRLLVAFATPQRAVTPGQFAVFHHGDEVVGCGEIVRGW